MKQLLLSYLSFFVIVAATAQSIRIPVQGEQTKMKIESNSGLSFTAALNIGELILTKTETPAGYFTVIDLPKFTKRFDDGRPGIPVFSQLIEIPTNGNASVSNISFNVVEYDLDDLGFTDKIIPAQPSWSKNPFPPAKNARPSIQSARPRRASKIFRQLARRVSGPHSRARSSERVQRIFPVAQGIE